MGAKIINLQHDAKSYAPSAIEMVVVVDASVVPVCPDDSTILMLVAPDCKYRRLMVTTSLSIMVGIGDITTKFNHLFCTCDAELIFEWIRGARGDIGVSVYAWYDNYAYVFARVRLGTRGITCQAGMAIGMLCRVFCSRFHLSR